MKIRKAFSLIELLVVVLIMGILASVSFTSYFKTVEKTRLSEVTGIMRNLKDGLDDYILSKGKPDSNLGYGPTLTILNVQYYHTSIYIPSGPKNNEYRIYAMLTNNFGGWWIHVDSDKYGGSVIRWQADGKKTCQSSGDFAFLCSQLKADGLAN